MTTSRIQIAVLAALVVAAVACFFLGSTAHTTMFLVTASASGFFIHRGAKRYNTETPGIWNAAIMSCAILAVSATCRLFGPASLVQICAVLELVGSLIAVAALHRISKLRDDSADRNRVIDSVIIAGGFGTLVWYFEIIPSFHLENANMSTRLMGVAAAAVCIWIAFSGVRLVLSTSLNSWSVRFIAGATAFALLTHLMGNSRNSVNTLSLVSASFCYALVALAAMDPSMRALTKPAARPSGHYNEMTKTRLILMTLAMMIAPSSLTGLANNQMGDGFVMISLITCWVMVTLFVMVRLAGLVQARESVVQTERALSRASASLVVSSDLSSRYRSAVGATIELLGPSAEDASVSLLISTPQGWRIVADGRSFTDAPYVEEMVPNSVMESYLSGDNFSARLLSRNLHGNEHFIVERELLHFLLRAQGGTSGAILISTAQPLNFTLMNGLSSLASSVSLAIEAAALTENLHQRRSEAQFRSLVEKSPDIILVVNQYGKTTFVSPVGETVLGEAGNSLEELLRPLSREDQIAVINLVARTKNNEKVEAVEFEIQVGDRKLVFETTANNLLDDVKVNGVVLNARDISERKNLESDLRHKVLHDALTGIANRTLFRDRLDHALKMRLRNPSSQVAVLFIDLDDFKIVNDGLGHDAGDELLKVVAFRLESHVRAQDTAARLGGDEFAILFEGLENTEAVMEASHRVLNALVADVEFGDRSMAVGASIGVAIAEGDVTSEVLLRNADVAMYDAKRTGKHNVRLFDQSMYVSAVERLELKADVVHAVAKNELALHYQPLVRLSDNKLMGFEALLRWNHPTLGWVSPDSFVPLAEDTGAIMEMGAWVLQEACRQTYLWQQDFGVEIGININVSPRQLTDDRIIEDLASALRNSGIRPEKVTLEITEGEGLDDLESRRRLIALRDQGCRVAADDFGTGFASYAALQQLPFTDVKIDRSLIQGLSDGDPRARAQVSSIIQMGHALGLMITAEGIEDARQADALVALEADHGQGYLIGRPASPKQAAEHITGLTNRPEVASL